MNLSVLLFRFKIKPPRDIMPENWPLSAFIGALPPGPPPQ